MVAIVEKALQGTVEATEIWMAKESVLSPGWSVELGTADPPGS